MLDQVYGLILGSIIPILLWLVSALLVAFLSMKIDLLLDEHWDTALPIGFICFVLYAVVSFVAMTMFLPSWIEYFLGTMI